MNINYYGMSKAERYMADLGRKLVKSAEEMTIEYTDEEWNAAVTAGDKLTRFGTLYGPKSFTKDFSKEERKVILQYLDYNG
jgi:hypothetical protein